ncbi:MAG: hypothetical protein IKE90_03435 [Bacilli bacterium]|nr:hypothetical protein [Bacilli bacterium]
MYRKPLDFSSLPLVIQEMIEDSSGAAAIIDELIEKKGDNNALTILIILDDMNIRGIQITNLYKMCDSDIEKFYEKVLTMTEKDIENINYESYTVCVQKAIYDGSKEDRENNPEKYLFTDEERNNMRNIKSKDRALNILETKIKAKQDDLYPSITKKEALSIINKHGFTCGYKKTYETNEKKIITYRVFYNDLGDIIYTSSLENPDIFLWGECKLNAMRKNEGRNLELIGCNTYKNIKEVIGYNIDLRKKPFETYQKILDKNEKLVDKIKHNYYNNNLIPIISSNKGIEYLEKNKEYDNVVIKNICDLLTFKETYYDLDKKLKEIYKPLLTHAEEKAYDELLYQLNTDKGIDIALKLQEDLGIKLDKQKLYKAKERFLKTNKKHYDIPKSKFLSDAVVDDPKGNDINSRIIKIVTKDILATKV